jgi:hypothetical protein
MDSALGIQFQTKLPNPHNLETGYLPGFHIEIERR